MKVPIDDICFAPFPPARPRNRLDASAGRANSAALASVVVGSLMLDSKGSILACTDNVAQMCGVKAEDMTDLPVKFFLPGVPLNAGTEGYNVAFVAFFWATGRVEALNVATATGNTVQVEGRFTLLKVETRYLFRLQLRWTDNAGAGPVARLRFRHLATTATPRTSPGRHRPNRIRH